MFLATSWVERVLCVRGPVLNSLWGGKGTVCERQSGQVLITRRQSEAGISVQWTKTAAIF